MYIVKFENGMYLNIEGKHSKLVTNKSSASKFEDEFSAEEMTYMVSDLEYELIKINTTYSV